MLIYLIGYMASGKSTLGRLLAGRIGFSFIDADDWISNESGLSIPDYFNLKGEEAFRQEELRLLRYISMSERTVVACGGGMPCFNNNMDLMNSTGLTVWLDVPSDILIERLKNDNDQRPLLKLTDELNLLVEQQLSERMKYYEKAKLHVKHTSIESIIEEIRDRIPRQRK